MGYKERKIKERIKNIVVLGIIIWLIYLYFCGPLHQAPGVNQSSEWYVNDLYMSNQYYYENLLNEEEKNIYRTIFEKYNEMEEEFRVEGKIETVSKVLDALICDHPEMINIISFKCYDYEDSVKIITKYLTKSKFSLNLKVRKMQRKIEKIVKETEGKSDFEKEKYIYEWLGENSNYGTKILDSEQSAYTAFSIMSNTVCVGHGKAAQILLNNCGIESILNVNSDHIWNTVKIDEEYYFFDSTLATTTKENLSGNVSYMGLNQNMYTSDYEILYPDVLPEVVGTKYNYFDYYGLTLTYTDDSLGEIQKILNKTEFKKVEIKFTNPELALEKIQDNEDYLGIRDVTSYYNSDGHCKNNGVIMIIKK